MSQPKMQIFRGADAPSLVEAACMSLEATTPFQQEGMRKMIDAGMLEGDEVRVLVSIPGFSLTYAWFKPDYPLPLHSHDADCLYYVIAGSLQLGTESLGPRDSFFLPAGAPYSYRPGPQGVEVLEFRHATEFNFSNHAKNAAFFSRAVETIAASREDWRLAKRPSEPA